MTIINLEGAPRLSLFFSFLLDSLELLLLHVALATLAIHLDDGQET